MLCGGTVPEAATPPVGCAKKPQREPPDGVRSRQTATGWAHARSGPNDLSGEPQKAKCPCAVPAAGAPTQCKRDVQKT